jgi:hypothetical protein
MWFMMKYGRFFHGLSGRDWFRQKLIIVLSLIVLALASGLTWAAVGPPPPTINFGNPWEPSANGTFAYVMGDKNNPTDFGIEYDGIPLYACAALLTYFNKQASSVYGTGTITGLIGTSLNFATAPATGTHTATPGGAVIDLWGSAQSCSGTVPAGLSGINSIAIWFDMNQM